MESKPVAVTLHHGNCLDVLRTLPSESVDSVVTDPPYGLSNTDPKHVIEALTRWAAGERDFVPEGRGFMGKSWDSFVPPPAVWDECLRVLKPGGHLLAFAGSRTFDLMTLSIRFAGFDIRDGIAWLYGSGFPKSLNVATAVDKHRAAHPAEVLLPDEDAFCTWMRNHSGLTEADAKRHLGSARFISGEVEVVNTATKDSPRWGRRAMVPTAAAWGKVRPFLAAVPPAWVEDLVKLPPQPSGSTPGDEWTPGKGQGTAGTNEWEGWGTALKPAFEPVVVARKPLGEKTVAANVLAHGTGALNIDGCRVGDEQRTNNAGGVSSLQRVSRVEHGYRETVTESAGQASAVSGRWPANVVLDESQAEVLDEQSGKSVSKSGGARGSAPRTAMEGGTLGDMPRGGHDDSGGASRFFYVAKAPKKERPVVEHEDGTKTAHPTVKPLTLMRWLVKLVTPPGGTVLEPFPGSGTTVEAAVLEGFDCIAAEREAEYIPLIEQRMARNGVTPTIIRPEPELTWEERRVAAYWCPVYVPAPHPRGHQPGCECVGQLPEILPEVEPA